MQKIKFQIKGIHCASCVILIEEHLKNKTGIMNAKVNLDSQKAVIVYDEEKINEEEIIKIIKEAGNYQVEKTKDTEEEENINASENVSRKKCIFEDASPKLTFVLGLFIGIAIFSLIGFIFLLSKEIRVDSGKNIAGNKDFVPNIQPPTTPPPSEESKTTFFEITKNNHIRGDFNAPITLVEFSDFECPFCEKHYKTLNKVLADYKSKVRLVYKHFPLGFHSNAQKAAEASECADEQGKFWEYHDKLFENQPNGYSLEKFKQWAKDLDLNSGKFNECLDSDKYAQKVQTDYQEGTQKGVNGTPATFINGQLVSGAVPYESFKQIIEQILNQ